MCNPYDQISEQPHAWSTLHDALQLALYALSCWVKVVLERSHLEFRICHTNGLALMQYCAGTDSRLHALTQSIGLQMPTTLSYSIAPWFRY